ncbi:MAG: integrase core domain-containing protein [Thermonemataceae bacterium]
MKEVRDLTEQWIVHYNERRPHESLGHKTPAMVA